MTASRLLLGVLVASLGIQFPGRETPPGGAEDCGPIGDTCPIVCGDILIVPSACTYVLDDALSLEHVYVLSGGTLKLGGGALLIISDTLHIRGAFLFDADAGETTPILRASPEVNDALDIYGPVTVKGSAGGIIDSVLSGFVRLQSGASITAHTGALTIATPLQSEGTIDACGGNILISGDLENNGVVKATRSTILLTADVENNGTIFAAGDSNGDDIVFLGSINYLSSGLFQVTAPNSEMVLGMSSCATISAGADFNVRAGCMRFQQSLTTNGGYKQTGGKIMADAGVTFSATGAFR